MISRSMHAVLALFLAMGAFAGTALNTAAQDEPNVMHFPWVPNGAMIDDDRGYGPSGPFYGTLTVQNLENEQIHVFYETTATGKVGMSTLESTAVLTLTVEDLFDDEDDVDGSGVIVWGEVMSGDIFVPARIAAVQKQAAPSELSDVAGTGDEHQTVAGYTGLARSGIDEYAVLPIAQTNSNWNTLIRVTNFDDDAAVDMTLILNPAGGGAGSSYDITNLDPGQTETLDLLDLGLPAEWVGSAILSGHDTDADIGAVAERVKNETSMLMLNSSQLLPDEDGEAHAPLVFNNFNFWNTGIAVASLDESGPVDVAITYYDLEGNTVDDPESFTLPSLGMDFIYTPTPPDGGGDSFVGSAIVEADGPVTGAVDEVKYFGDDLDTGHAMSYMLEEGVATSSDAGNTLVMPLIQAGIVDDSDVVHGDTSGVQLFNPSDDLIPLVIVYFDRDGNEELSGIMGLESKHGLTLYPPNIGGLEDGFEGTVGIQIPEGDGAVVGVSNNVNYDVEFDGSASLNMIQTGDIGIEVTDEEPRMLD